MTYIHTHKTVHTKNSPSTHTPHTQTSTHEGTHTNQKRTKARQTRSEDVMKPSLHNPQGRGAVSGCWRVRSACTEYEDGRGDGDAASSSQ